MKPWNPYAMTFHGQPLIGQTPPKLVVYGPPLTAQQGAMLQTAYNAFVGAARTSIAPNPSRQGRLADGSPYIIECSGASCTCTVWTSGAGKRRDEGIFSGILFSPSLAVLTNAGAQGIPSRDWSRKTAPHGSGSTYFPNRPPYAIGLSTANTSYLLPGKMRYLYRGYGTLTGRYGLLTAITMHTHFTAIGVSSDRKRFLLLRSVDKLSYCFSDVVDMSKVFLPFGSPSPSELTPITVDATTERTLSESDTSLGAHGYTGRASVNRRGDSIVYMERHIGRRATASDVKNSKVTLVRRNIFRASIVDELYNPGRIYSAYSTDDKRADELPVKTFDDTEKVFSTRRTADGFSPGNLIYTVPAFEANAKTKILASFMPASEQINLVGSVLKSAVAATGRRAPAWAPSARLEVSASGLYWYVRGSSTASGSISGTWRRDEKSHYASPHYMGDKLVMLKHTDARKYEQRCSGTVDYADLDGTFGYGEYQYGNPVWPVAGDRPTGALEARRNTNQTITGFFESDNYYTLENGENLYLQKYRYTETGTLNINKSYNDRSGSRHETETRTHTLTYSVTHERRLLLVYDPELDLLCYSEGVYSLTRESQLDVDFESVGGVTVKDNFTFTPTAIPEAPMLNVVIKCRGETLNLEYPFPVDDPFDLLSLLPNTGVSPYASGRDIRTDAGFPGVPIEITTDYSGIKISLQGGNEDRDDAEQALFRGLPPNGAISRPEVRYIKTPETGAALLAVRVTHGATTWINKAFVVDSAGVREAAGVVSLDGVDPQDNSVEPF